MWAIPFIVIFVAAAIIVIPVLFIWALNVLFGLNIAYSTTTWLAAAVILAAIHGGKGWHHCNCYKK